jgi:hypothetical protein
MPVGKFRFWWEGKKAAYRAWSRKRVIRSERARLESEIARNLRRQRRKERWGRRRVAAREALRSSASRVTHARVTSRDRMGLVAARALPQGLAINATARIWEEACRKMPDRHPRSITFHEGLLKMAEP